MRSGGGKWAKQNKCKIKITPWHSWALSFKTLPAFDTNFMEAFFSDTNGNGGQAVPSSPQSFLFSTLRWFAAIQELPTSQLCTLPNALDSPSARLFRPTTASFPNKVGATRSSLRCFENQANDVAERSPNAHQRRHCYRLLREGKRWESTLKSKGTWPCALHLCVHTCNDGGCD